MLQILLNHVFRHLAYRGTKIPPRPKMSTPILLFQARILIKQLARSATFDPPHDLARCHRRGTTDQNMYMILAHHTLYYPDLTGFARLANQLSHSLRHLSDQHFVAIFRHPYKALLNLKNRITAIPVFHAAPPLGQHIVAAKAGGLHLVVDS